MGTLPDAFERLRRTPDDLAAAIASRPAPLLHRRPTETAWAATEVICHLRDVEEAWLGRIRAVLANDQPAFQAIDPDRWARARQYLRNNAAEALDAFREWRAETLALLGSLAPAQWERVGLHPTRGRLTLRELVGVIAWHDDNHLAQLQRALDGRP